MCVCACRCFALNVFNGISTFLWIFYAYRLRKSVHCSFIYLL